VTLDEPASVRVRVRGLTTSFTSLRQALLFVWDNMESFESLKWNGKTIKIGDEIWKR